MALAFAPPLYTVAEYLTLERAAEERHEYLDGYIYQMAGESDDHGRICMNLAGLVHPQLRGTPCEGRIANTKVRSGPLPLSPHLSKGLFSYPDVLVACDPIQYHDSFRDIIINPVVIFEVLSPSTEEFDRDIKFERYDRWNPSLQDYLLVAQHVPKIEHYTRQADGSWRYRVYRGLETSFTIESVKCSLSLADIYERVTFPPPPVPKLQVVPKKAAHNQAQTAGKAKQEQKEMKAISTTVLIAALWLLSGVAHATPALVIGQPAPDFTLKDLNGAKHTLKDARGQLTVIAFLSVQCPISNAYNERIRELIKDYAAQNVRFLAINASANETVAEIKAHADKQGFEFPILKDKGNKVADLYGAERTPEIFVVDAQGILRYHGRIDNSHLPIHVKRRDLRAALDELLAGKPVSVPEAKALGCVIKRESSAQRFSTASSSERVSLNPANPLPAGFATAFAPQRPNPKPRTIPAKIKPAVRPANLALLKPVDFPKLRDSYKGKVIVLNFWATWCAPCVAEMPEFVKLDAEYRSKGVQVIAISADDTTDLKTLVARFVKEKGMTFPVYVQDTDDPQQMIDLINKDWPGVLPATFIYDKQGKLILSRFGIIDRELLVNTVEQVLK